MSMMQKFNYQEGIHYALRKIRFMMLEGQTIEQAIARLEQEHLQEMKGLQQWFKAMGEAMQVMNQDLEQDMRERNG